MFIYQSPRMIKEEEEQDEKKIYRAGVRQQTVRWSDGNREIENRAWGKKKKHFFISNQSTD